MSLHPVISRTLRRHPALGALAYGAIVLACATASWLAVGNVLVQRTALATATHFLAELQQRWPAAQPDHRAAEGPSGSPFVTGETVTVAGSRLLQRVSGAITRVGGRVVSSQVDIAPARREPGFISVLVNCEIDQFGLQKALYDLEAGMPFLFVKRLEVHVPEGEAHDRMTRMHVLISVSGQWRPKP